MYIHKADAMNMCISCRNAVGVGDRQGRPALLSSGSLQRNHHAPLVALADALRADVFAIG